MKKEQEYLESLIFFMKERIEFLTSSMVDNEKAIKENEDYAKGLYKGLQMAQQDEIDFLQSYVDYFNKKLKRNNDSDKAV
ncbi:hypothetical protein [Bacillus thuringiensis]|uniref:hypothetical protein n=1 Tax=Bacillus thuringiensis TaxID=1428 RepID=UPI0039879FFF